MELFRTQNGKLLKLDENQFALEKDIQKLTEENLDKIFELQFVCSEFALNNLRIDTLAFNLETKSFVIIEYKKDKNFTVIDQGFAYLALLLNNKADFILAYHKQHGKTLKKEEIEWSQSKVIFVAPSFTDYQQKAVHFKNLPIELWEIKKYQNDIVGFNQLLSPESSESITTIAPGDETITKVNKEIKVYTEDYHVTNANDELQEVYQKIKRSILELGDDIKIVPRQLYIAFKRKINFVDIEFQKARLKLFLNLKKGKLEDPRNIARDISNMGHWGNGDYEVSVTPQDDLTYILTLIKQAYDRNK